MNDITKQLQQIAADLGSPRAEIIEYAIFLLNQNEQRRAQLVRELSTTKQVANRQAAWLQEAQRAIFSNCYDDSSAAGRRLMELAERLSGQLRGIS